MKIMKSSLVCILSILHLCKGQYNNIESDRGLFNRRPLYQQQSSPCLSGSYSGYDSVEEDVEGRKLILAAGAAVGGAALGYHLGMKHKNQIIINNNIHNDYPSPCYQVGGGGGVGGGGIGGGGGVVGGILGNHPILSNILQGGLWNGGGGSGAVAAGNRLPINRQSNNVNWNRAIRQFSRVVRPITRGFR